MSIFVALVNPSCPGDSDIKWFVVVNYYDSVSFSALY